MTDPKLPPQNLDAEMSILGGILIDNDAINRVLESIVPEDFYREAHRKIFIAMMQLSDRREPCDLVTLTETLKKKGELDEIGGAAYLLMLVDYLGKLRVLVEQGVLEDGEARLFAGLPGDAGACYALLAENRGA